MKAVEALGDLRFESEAGHGEKRMSIGEAGIDGAGLAGDEVFECSFDRSMQTEMAAQSVARTAGDEAKNAIRTDERAGDFVHRAVAADGYDQLAAVDEGLPREIAGMTGARRLNDVGTMTRGESLHRG